jgi:raffinose/stachyose/melibiose transport system substrate-binding protein
MNNRKNRPLTRRDFLKLAGMGLTAAGLSPLLQSCATPAATTVAPTAAATSAPPTAAPPAGGKNLKAWWWGEQEAPGLEGWVNESIALYNQKSGNTIEPTLQDTAVVISEFQTASAAKNPPDIQFLWNGIYHMESVWLGYLEPMDGLVPADEIAATQPTILSVFDGKTYRLGWYSAGVLWLYNKEMFNKAGLDGNTPPKTWDDLLNACDKLKTAGITPICAGLKDGYWGEWWMGSGLGQNLDTPADAINLFIGQLDWREPKYYEHWGREQELWKAGFINDDMLSVDLYPGIDMFGAGKAAMTAIVTPIAASQAKALGSSEKIGPMVFPVFGTGKMAGKAIADYQGFGISSQSQNKDVAADFLRSLHTPERVTALWNAAHVLPTDTSFDGNTIDDPLLKAIWEGWVANKDAVTYISDLMPVLFWTDAMFVNSQKIISGEYTPEQAGQNAYDVTQKWVQQNPDMVKNYAAWAKDLGAT